MELATLAGLAPMGFIGELVNDDGTMMRDQSLIEFSLREGIPILTIDEIAEEANFYEQLQFPNLIWADLPSAYGTWKIASFTGYDGSDHLVLKYGQPTSHAIVRVHSECVTGDALGSLRCDCGPQLALAMERISESGGGYIIYLKNHEGRGIGVAEKIKAYALQDSGLDTVEANVALGHPADLRDFRDAAVILSHLGVSAVTLLTNNPEKVTALDAAGIAVEIEPTEIVPNTFNESYLETKRQKFQHFIPKESN
jgi:3,4-dihydroxy 2-butanone 4-phosphate synthase/GTP cyclohydrolase II